MIVCKLSQKQLEKKLKLWQRRLRLQDWTIHVKLSPAWVSGPGTTFGQCWPDRRNKAAEIKILHPGDYDPDKTVVQYDAEQTLVHELLHVQYAGAEPSMQAKRYERYETATEVMSAALVQMHRRKR